jgi:hypothetical protein
MIIKNQTMKHFKITTILFLAIATFACTQKELKTEQTTFDADEEKKEINMMLDSFNLAAAQANFDTYFSFYSPDAIFTGTDATERWDKNKFMAYAKPHFDKGRAWSFTALERNIYFSKSGELAWFDELLNTQMKICRGSGVLEKQGNNWKLKQYILSTTIPNPIMDEVVKMKTTTEDSLINKLKL